MFILIYFNITEIKGGNINPREIQFDLYILNNATTIEKFKSNLNEANEIWKDYNISLKLNEIDFVDTLNDTEKSFLLNVNASEDKECFTYRNLISFSNKSQIRVLALDSNSDYKGRACICGCDSIILEPRKELLMDLAGWNLAHEFGHIFGLMDLINRYNLMCDQFKIIKPTFLNQEQMSSVQDRLN